MSACEEDDEDGGEDRDEEGGVGEAAPMAGYGRLLLVNQLSEFLFAAAIDATTSFT